MLKSLKLKLRYERENDRNSLIRWNNIGNLFEQICIVILMLKTLKIKFSDPLEKNVGYSSIGWNKDRIWFEPNCHVILMLKSLKLKIFDPFEKMTGML